MAMHNNSRWKKEIAHFLFYDNYIKKAAAIQYLTEREYEDSKYRFDGPHFIIPNGFTLPIKAKEQFVGDSLNAVFIGRFDVYHKGLDFIVDVCKKQQELLRKNKFVVSLYGTKTKDWYLLREQIENSGLNDVVKLYGPVTGKEKEDVLLNSDIFVMTSRFEGHPMGLIEALAYGLPVIASRGTNMYEEIEGSDAGWVCEPDVEGLEKAILTMIDEKNKLMEKGKNARNLSKNYDWDLLAMRFHQEVKALVNKE